MEEVKVREWMKVDKRYGYGSNSGYGFGGGSGFGSGDGSGDGSGYGSGYGFGGGSGYGSGDGSGFGFGDGSGTGDVYGLVDGDMSRYGSRDWSGGGSGYGFGSGSGIKSLNGQTVYMIDNVQTIITSIHLDMAKGFVLKDDLTLKPCYVVKGDGLFAHGETQREAQEALQKKIFSLMDTDEAIDRFCAQFKGGERYSGHEFYEWHHYLTGSCEMGRTAFVRNHDIDLDKTYTVEEFIGLTENDYGGEIIRRLKERFLP